MNQYITDFVITISKKHIALSINPGDSCGNVGVVVHDWGGGGYVVEGSGSSVCNPIPPPGYQPCRAATLHVDSCPTCRLLDYFSR